MKYSENLPKLSYNTSIGKFSITNFFSYYKYNFDTLTVQQIDYDSKTTLVEASAQIYQDANSFWLILLANQTINPFTLFKPNPTLYTGENIDKNTALIEDTSTTVPYYVSAGSLVTPFAATGGNEYDFSSVGNFDLNGDVYIIESQNFYNKRVVAKPGPDGSPTTFKTSSGSNNYKFIDSSSGASGYESVLKNSGSTAIIPFLEETAILSDFGVEIITEGSALGGGGFAAIGLAEESALQSVENTTTTTTTEQAVTLTNKRINVFENTGINKVTTRLIVLKYS